MEIVSEAYSHGGVQGVYRHWSETTQCMMTFAVFVPPQAKLQPVPVVWYLSGLTCTHANAMEKAEYRQAASELAVMVVIPDTSPRGLDVPDDPRDWRFGIGASFYVDATEAPYDRNYRMYSYLLDELPSVLVRDFPALVSAQAISGHSMGGHGALVLALRNPGHYRSCSAFSPIVHPMAAGWSQRAYRAYLGDDRTTWRAYDACALVEDGHRLPEILIDQGSNDQFLSDGLRPWLFSEACAKTGINVTLNIRDGYDHSYFFVSSFMADHIRWHAQRLWSGVDRFGGENGTR